MDKYEKANPTVRDWLLRFTQIASTGTPLEVSESLVMRGPSDPSKIALGEMGGSVYPKKNPEHDERDPVFDWLAENPRQYNRWIHEILVEHAGIGRIRRVFRRVVKRPQGIWIRFPCTKSCSDPDGEYSAFVLTVYGEALLANFLLAKPLWC